MMRKFIVVGDPPAPGGAVLPYSGPMMDVFGHRIALIGGRAYCEGCNSVGIIAKAGGPRRGWLRGAEMALEGDVVICHCPVPPPLVATLVHNTSFDDMLAGTREFNASYTAIPGWFAGDSPSIAASKKVVDEMVEHPPEAEQTENICPNMTNKEFCTLMLDLRDKAVAVISKKRLPELERWGKADQARVQEWFGVAGQSMREYLRKGLAGCEQVLRGLNCKNFVRLTPDGKTLSCIVPSYGATTVAMVCKPDTSTHTIAFNTSFCLLRDTSAGVDSKLSTLIHEVTHFDDTFGSFDSIYYLRESRKAVQEDRAKVKTNADNIAGYVIWDEVFYA
ncbi:putative Zn-binding protein involved in type VI secretion [Variovorax sp. OAS795]|uniref:M35 family metallo-endopeptidase n=1 Tax=Variovorax sp. OAS795 TaxID=3034231 RepID=UPI00339B68FA